MISRVVTDLKDDSEPMRKMVMECMDEIIKSLGTADLGDRLVKELVDGILFAFQEQTIEDERVLNAFGTIGRREGG
jgi:splicing factor 3B subunit 1